MPTSKGRHSQILLSIPPLALSRSGSAGRRRYKVALSAGLVPAPRDVSQSSFNPSIGQALWEVNHMYLNQFTRRLLGIILRLYSAKDARARLRAETSSSLSTGSRPRVQSRGSVELLRPKVRRSLITFLAPDSMHFRIILWSFVVDIRLRS